MNSKKVVGISMIFCSFALSYFIPIPVIGATLFAVLCVLFGLRTSSFSALAFFLPLMFLKTYDAIVLSYMVTSSFFTDPFFCIILVLCATFLSFLGVLTGAQTVCDKNVSLKNMSMLLCDNKKEDW